EALTPSVSLRPRRVRAPAARQPASPKSHPNSSASFEDHILGGAPPPDRGGIPIPSGGSVSPVRFWLFSPLTRAALGWAACRASGRLVRGRPRRAVRARTVRRIFASPGSNQVWTLVLQKLGLVALAPDSDVTSFPSWWCGAIKKIPKDVRK
ncbi:Protein kinase superfamily protein, partial [Zea mays]